MCQKLWKLASSRQSYCKKISGLLFGPPCIACLQQAQHALARVVKQQSSRSSSLTSTKLLHWLPIEWQIKFKLPSLIFKALYRPTSHPPYLAELLQYHKPTRSMHSSAGHLLSVPRHIFSFGSRAFRISAPKIWNSLSPHILQSETLFIYTSFVDPLLSVSLHWPLAPITNAPWFLLRLWRYINHSQSLSHLVSQFLSYLLTITAYH